MADSEDVCVLIPTYDEAATIGAVVDGFHEQGYDDVLVVDGHSTDDTHEIAAEHGARVITQSGRGRGGGKGQAVREGLEHVDSEYVLLLDGDGTYRPEDAERLLEPVVSGEYEHVIGNRFADMEDGAMTRMNRFGNRIFGGLYRYIHGQERHDILSGYRAFTADSVEGMNLTSQGFGIETEFTIECARQGIEMGQVPITYRARPEDSETNLNPVSDGWIILKTLYRMAKVSNPLFYFGSVGVVGLVVGVLLGAYVGYEWVYDGVGHEIYAVVSAFSILVGVQLLIFGVLSDMIVTLHKEQMRRLQRLSRRVDGTDAGADGRSVDEGTADRPGTDPDDAETPDPATVEGPGERED